MSKLPKPVPWENQTPAQEMAPSPLRSVRKSPRRSPKKSSPSEYFIDEKMDLHPINVNQTLDFYFQKEGIRRPENYFSPSGKNARGVIKDGITSKKRLILVDWMRFVTKKFNLLNDTFFLAVDLLDRFLSLKTVNINKMQGVGIGALLVASKYEETFSPSVEDFIWVSNNVIQKPDILRIENIMLTALNWDITVPTSYTFLLAFNILDKHKNKALLEKRIDILVNTSLFYNLIIKFKPSLIAAAAIYFSNKLMGYKPAWNSTLENKTGYSISNLIPFANEYNKLVQRPSKNRVNLNSQLLLPTDLSLPVISPSSSSSDKRKKSPSRRSSSRKRKKSPASASYQRKKSPSPLRKRKSRASF